MRGTTTTVTDAGVLLHRSGEARGEAVTVKTTADVALGGAGVTFAGGFLLSAGDGPVTVTVPSGEVLHGITATATTATVYVLEPQDG